MAQFHFFFFSIFVFHLTAWNGVHGLQFEKAVERKCHQNTGYVTEHLTPWEDNTTTLYIPMFSRMDAYHLTQSLFKQEDIAQITDQDIARSCIYVKPAGDVFTFHGFCGRSFSKTLTALAPKVLHSPPTFVGGVSCTIRFSLSDRFYKLLEVCWGDDQASFAVLSSKPTLSECDKKVIKTHLLANGFKEEFIITPDYRGCPHACSDCVNKLGRT